MIPNSKPKSANWRIVIPNLTEYKDASAEELQKLKQLILQRLHRRPQLKTSNIKSEFQRGLQYYHIALERHANDVPNLDVLLIYDKSIRRQLTDYDYLLKHGNISTYRRLSQAIIDYGKKYDKQALSNLPDDKVTAEGQSISQLIELQQFKKDPYRYLELQMLKDPMHFHLQQYVQKNQLARYINGWSALKTKLKDMQAAAANSQLKNKPGFKFIDRALIQSILSPSELTTYDSWSGYQTIVNKFNQMILQRGNRQSKARNLLLTGLPDTGKSALIWQRNPSPGRNAVSNFCSVYPMGMSKWFPPYHSDVYHCIYWNEAKLTSYSYDTILKLLDGSPIDLQTKGSASRKIDNPLVIMTSNLTLDQMIKQKFSRNSDYMAMARKNLAVRIQNVVIPEGYDLFLLQKLLISEKINSEFDTF